MKWRFPRASFCRRLSSRLRSDAGNACDPKSRRDARRGPLIFLFLNEKALTKSGLFFSGPRLCVGGFCRPHWRRAVVARGGQCAESACSGARQTFFFRLRRFLRGFVRGGFFSLRGQGESGRSQQGSPRSRKPLSFMRRSVRQELKLDRYFEFDGQSAQLIRFLFTQCLILEKHDSRALGAASAGPAYGALGGVELHGASARSFLPSSESATLARLLMVLRPDPVFTGAHPRSGFFGARNAKSVGSFSSRAESAFALAPTQHRDPRHPALRRLFWPQARAAAQLPGGDRESRQRKVARAAQLKLAPSSAKTAVILVQQHFDALIGLGGLQSGQLQKALHFGSFFLSPHRFRPLTLRHADSPHFLHFCVVLQPHGARPQPIDCAERSRLV